MSYPRFTSYLLKSLLEELSFSDPLSSMGGEACPIHSAAAEVPFWSPAVRQHEVHLPTSVA